MLTIKQERLRRKWTQTQLGAKAGLSASDVSKIESGRQQPDPQQTLRLARALKVPAELLLKPAELE